MYQYYVSVSYINPIGLNATDKSEHHSPGADVLSVSE